MTTKATPTVRHRRLRAPRHHGGRLVTPPLAELSAVIRQNRVSASASDVLVLGQPLRQFSVAARHDLLESARIHTSHYLKDAALWDFEQQTDAPLILTGHQPSLFHPGVWYKNFLTHQIATAHSAIPLHLIIDNDIASSPAIDVPQTGMSDAIKSVSVRFDSGGQLPYEETVVEDSELFASFGDRVTATIQPLVSDPMITDWWHLVREMAPRFATTGQAISAARHTLEHDWGMKTLEVPLSKVCDTSHFRRFFLHILNDLDRFHAIHNRVLGEYRQVHRLRTTAQPVPDLGADGDWLELPLWVWTSTAPQRRAVWARRSDRNWHLKSVGPSSADPLAGIQIHAHDLSEGHATQAAVMELAQLRQAGVKLRPRALLTTMYARLVLSDLFVHGIGGAKYDQITDHLIQDFVGTPPPTFVTATATFHLPVERPQIHQDDCRRIAGLLRELWYQPERHVDLWQLPDEAREQLQKLMQEKERLVQTDTTGKGTTGKNRHQRLEEINELLRTAVATMRAALLEESDQLKCDLRRDSILGSREYSFCLFPKSELRSYLTS